MEIIIHRGSKQIGGTCIEIRSDKTRLIFDIGEELPDTGNPEKVKTKLSVDDLFVDSEITDRKIDGIFISHNHGDHIGLFELVKDEIPVFIGKTALEVQNTIFDFISKDRKVVAAEILSNEVPIQINDFKVTPYLIDHSAFDAYAFLIECDDKKVIYSGDFRRHGTKRDFTERFSKNSRTHEPDVLLIEGTNIFRNDFTAEHEDVIGVKAEAFMKEINGNIFVLQSSANIDRIEQLQKACKNASRTLVIDIFTAHILSSIPDHTFSDIRIFYPFWLTKKMHETLDGTKKMNRFSRRKISKEDLKTRRDLCILVRENMLFDIEKRMDYTDSGLIYSKWEGYKKDLKTKRFLEFFNSHKLETKSLHTSGHADIQTIKDFVKDLNPKTIIPVHTETPQKYKEIFGELVSLIDDKIIIKV
jgi:ribonuclease J